MIVASSLDTGLVITPVLLDSLGGFGPFRESCFAVIFKIKTSQIHVIWQIYVLFGNSLSTSTLFPLPRS
jgi:hypothetical protein